MPCEFKIVRRVEFSETDMAGIVHFSNFFRYMECAEHGFFRSLGSSIVMDDLDPPVGWPRVHAACDYLQPLRFENEVEIHLLVSGKTSKSLSYLFRFRNLSASPPVEVARGKLTVVCVTRGADGKMTAAKIPQAVADRIQLYQLVQPRRKNEEQETYRLIPECPPGFGAVYHNYCQHPPVIF
jgi:YbgC/YbaW family acyl-CoA thioester hydrolase